MDDGEQIALRRDEAAFIDPGPLDQAGNRGGDQGIVEIELRLHQLPFRPFQNRFRRQLFGNGVIEILWLTAWSSKRGRIRPIFCLACFSRASAWATRAFALE